MFKFFFNLVYQLLTKPLNFSLQNDTVMGTLTVKENIAFSANLRLPRKKYSSQMMKEKVENVIDELGLQSCAETMVSLDLE